MCTSDSIHQIGFQSSTSYKVTDKMHRIECTHATKVEVQNACKNIDKTTHIERAYRYHLQDDFIRNNCLIKVKILTC